MTVKMLILAMTCKATGTSNKNAALLVGAGFQDLEIITKEDNSKTVDKSNIHRERVKLWKKLNTETDDNIKFTRFIY